MYCDYVGSRLDGDDASARGMHWDADYNGANIMRNISELRRRHAASRNGESGCEEYIVTMRVVGWTTAVRVLIEFVGAWITTVRIPT